MHENSVHPSEFSLLWFWTLMNFQFVWPMDVLVVGFCVCSACVGCCAIQCMDSIRHNLSPPTTKHFWTGYTISQLSPIQPLSLSLLHSSGHSLLFAPRTDLVLGALPSNSTQSWNKFRSFFRNIFDGQRSFTVPGLYRTAIHSTDCGPWLIPVLQQVSAYKHRAVTNERLDKGLNCKDSKRRLAQSGTQVMVESYLVRKFLLRYASGDGI